ncbi:MAG: RNase adapter RapZ [Peptoniphilaceae bacterium]|nr:RNase adapter RapZ [Peptoniphilaceae bacterium]
MEIFIITGMSGAGKTTALKIFEEYGFYTMDNITGELLKKFLEINEENKKPVKKLAVVIDQRSYKIEKNFYNSVQLIKGYSNEVNIIFLYSDSKKIIQRYNELRKPHPFSINGNPSDGIIAENDYLKIEKKYSDFVIDTTNYKEAELKKIIEKIINYKIKNIINIFSFGFKYGILENGDIIFDMRFLPNPFYEKDLKDLNGTDEKIKNFLNQFAQTKTFINKSLDMIEFLLPNFKDQGKNILNIGFGCTGGKHRSVFMAEEMAKNLKNKYKIDYTIILNHRDIGR